MADDKEEIVDVPVAFLELELADGNGITRGEIHVVAGPERATRLPPTARRSSRGPLLQVRSCSQQGTSVASLLDSVGRRHAPVPLPDAILFRTPFLFLAFAFRTFAAASLAFFALAVRCSAVIVSNERLPPIRPPFAPCSLKNARTSGGSFFTARPS